MPSIKTAISVEKSLLDKIDATAKNMSLSRSKFFALAAKNYLQQIETRELIEKLNEAYGDGLDDEETKAQAAMITVLRRHAEDAWQ